MPIAKALLMMTQLKSSRKKATITLPQLKSQGAISKQELEILVAVNGQAPLFASTDKLFGAIFLDIYNYGNEVKGL